MCVVSTVCSEAELYTVHGLFFSLLVQLIIAVAGVLTGYNGSFEFKEPGQEYGEYPYVGMRVVSPCSASQPLGGKSEFTHILSCNVVC